VQPVSGTITATQGTTPWVDNLVQVAGVVLGATAVTAFGTAPAAANVPGVNSSIFAGTTGITATGTSLNVNVTGTTGGALTIEGDETNNAAAPEAAAALEVLPAIANAASPAWTEGFNTLISVDLTGRQRVRGTLSTNVAAPAGDAQSSLNYIANAVAPTYTEGNLVLGSVDLNGNTRIIGTRTNNAAAPSFEVNVSPALANAANPSWTEGFQVLESVDLSGRQRIMGQNPIDATFTGSPVVVAGVDAAGLVQELPVANSNTTVLTTVLQVGGSVTTAAPTYTTGTTNPLSLDIAGNLRVSTSPAAGATTTVLGNLTNNNAAPAATNIGTLPALAKALAPLWTEGDQVLESVDLYGGQRIISGNPPEATASWTSATALNTALTMTTLGYAEVVVTFNQTTTLTAGAVTFEVSDTTAFTNAYTITGLQVNSANTGTTYSFVASANQGWIVNVAGWAAFRVRLSTVITGTGTVNVGIAENAVNGSSNITTLFNGTAIGVRSVGLANAIADNNLKVSLFVDSVGISGPLYVADSVYGGAFSGTPNAALQGWDKMRASTVFRTVAATASGNTAIWTPGSGNKFRLLKLFIEVTDNASLAAGGVLTIDIQDATTSTNITFSVFVPQTAVTTVIGDGAEIQVDLGSLGILSAAANNVLNVNLSSALVTGVCRIIAQGVEE
jgi:hypothetical protein